MRHARKRVRITPLQLFVCILIQPVGFALGWFVGFAFGVW
ncbi:hypothetical protein HOS59_gp38 [Streptomyces phage Rowa]|uniref:Uncharacterized protein n=1 Tax=Streptomyces phage Rowa TaxID=2059883 RepID=A0A2H5BLX2_9CAUD|nr:hypothetical protein HOS59_gp38 [Streptomyces phage Rowa]AUG87302.1 hypothetical protein SEA_ROWA_38 [Streptomyces phage Rowa]